MLDFSFDSWKPDYSLFSGSVAPELPDWTLSTGTPQNYVPFELPQLTSIGGVFDSGLKTVSATASSLLDVFGKFYALDNQVDQAKYMREMQKSEQQLREAQLKGSTQVALARTEAERNLAIAQSEAAVAQAQAQIQSSQRASVIQAPGSGMPPAFLLIALVGGAYFLFKGSK